MTTPDPPLANVLIVQWLMARLKNDPTLITLVNGRVEVDDAGDSIVFPYILISVLDPARPYYMVGARPASRNGVYLVRGVNRGRGYEADLAAIAARIIVLLHGQRDEEAGIVSCILREEYTNTYDSKEQSYRDLGGQFDISAVGAKG